MILVGAATTLAAEAVGAVDGLSAGRAERDLGVLAAGRARGAEHLAGTAVAAVAATTAAAAVTAAGRIAAAGAIAAVAAVTGAATRVAGSLAAGPTRRAT